jgi:hypothetical protein
MAHRMPTARQLTELTTVGSERLDPLHNGIALDNMTEHNVLAIEPRSRNGCDEELQPHETL